MKKLLLLSLATLMLAGCIRQENTMTPEIYQKYVDICQSQGSGFFYIDNLIFSDRKACINQFEYCNNICGDSAPSVASYPEIYKSYMSECTTQCLDTLPK